MAATLMQPPVHRPSMDHSPSFDSATRSSSAAPFATSSFDGAPSPAGAPRSRTSSNSLASSSPSSPIPPGAAYPQPYSNHFYSNTPHHFNPQHQQHWPPGAAHPAPGFYAPPYAAFPGAPGPYAQQQPADFAAWAHVYQQMVAGGHMAGPGVMPTHHHDIDDYGPPVADVPRRRTASGPTNPVASVVPGKGSVQQPQPFHPYKRAPRTSTSRESTSSVGSGGGAVSGMTRSTSQPGALNSVLPRGTPPPSDEHRRNQSSDSAQLRGGPSSVGAPGNATANDNNDDLVPPRPRIRTDEQRRYSSSSQGSSRSGSASPGGQQHQSRTGSPTVTSTHSRSRSASGSSSPLTSGAIAASATNAARPSPLSQSAGLPSALGVEDQKKGVGMGGGKGRKPSLASDPSAKQHQSSQAQPAPQPQRIEQSASSRLPRANGSVPLAPPSAPFVNAQAMGSEVSLAETQRTTGTAASVATGATTATGKQRRSLFRMRNKSSDNISLSSTVSSASMMIRKMGNLGKLARRNSLMGISKIFKEKPKDEDAALPERQGGFSFKKKGGKKSEASPAAVSRAYAELDRDLSRLSEDDDRVLSGLSPAAQLARQHTVKSRAEQAKKDAEKKAALEVEAAAHKRELEAQEMGATTGVGTWDNSTTTNRASYAAAAAAADAASVPSGPNVVKVMPRQPNVVHHAFAVNQPDYDSDDSSEGDTIENMTASMQQSTISDRGDRDFEALWGKASIDPHARPKKGILKVCASNEHLEKLASKQEQETQATAEAKDPASHLTAGPLSDLAAPIAERIDGVAHAPHAQPPEPGFEIDFSSFDTALDLDLKPPVIYKNPVHNSSAPAISRAEGVDPQARTMSVPSRRRLVWAPECAVYSTYDALTYDRRSEPATCNRLTPELAMAIKQELNAFKLEMPVHPSSKIYTHYFA